MLASIFGSVGGYVAMGFAALVAVVSVWFAGKSKGSSDANVKNAQQQATQAVAEVTATSNARAANVELKNETQSNVDRMSANDIANSLSDFARQDDKADLDPKVRG